MSYPIDPADMPDPYSRGKVEMFNHIIEVRNEHPSWISDDAINKLYEEIDAVCSLRTKFAVLVEGTCITELDKEENERNRD